MYDILVLGAAGFIGGHIAKKAQAVGWRVHGFRRNPESRGHLQDLDIKWFNGSLEDYPSLLQAMSGMDYVFHAAASYPEDGNPALVNTRVETAAAQMKNVIRATREAHVKRLIYTSSLTTIGLPPENENRLADERDFYIQGTMPDNSYHEMKTAMENLALEASGVGYDIVILNPTLVLGPGDVHLSTGQILVMIAQGKGKFIPPGMLNVVDVRDAAEAHINAARIGKRGHRYILGGSNYTVAEAAAIFAEIANVKPPLFTLPTWLMDAYIKAGDKLPFVPFASDHVRAYKHWQGYNIEKAEKELGLKSRFLEETVRDSLSWFKNHGIL